MECGAQAERLLTARVKTGEVWRESEPSSVKSAHHFTWLCVTKQNVDASNKRRAFKHQDRTKMGGTEVTQNVSKEQEKVAVEQDVVIGVAVQTGARGTGDEGGGAQTNGEEGWGPARKNVP